MALHHRLLRFVRRLLAVARESQVNVAAAGLAYHAFNTLVSLSILLVVGVTAVDGFGVFLDALETGFGLDAGTLDGFEGAVDDGGGRLSAALLAAAIFGWSAIRLVQAVNSAFTEIYGSRKRQSLLAPVLTLPLIVLTLAGGVGLVVVVGVGMVLALDGLGWRLLSTPLLFGSLLVGFLPLYYFSPRADVSVREVLPGAALAAGSWAVLALGFRLYLATSETVALFGVAGAILMGLTWVYLGGLALLLGAVLNAVLADRVDVDQEWVPAPLSGVATGSERPGDGAKE